MTKKAYNEQARIRKIITGIIAMVFLFYIGSCGSEGTSSPSDNIVVDLDSIKSLTLEGVTDDSIKVSWGLLEDEEGVVDDTITYTVYAETVDGEGGFSKDSTTEQVYTTEQYNNLVGGTVEVTNLNNNTPYRIVVEAKDSSEEIISRSRLLAYTASELTAADVTGVEDSVETTTTPDQREVTVTWTPNPEAQGYVIKAIKKTTSTALGKEIANGVIAVVCTPDSLLCNDEGDKPEAEGDKLKYIIQIESGVRYQFEPAVPYDLVIVPFNFQDLTGLQAVDEEGVEKLFTEEVLAQIENNSSIGERLERAKRVPVTVRVTTAGAPTELSLSSTGSTITATWVHGAGAEYYHAILSSEGMSSVTNTIPRSIGETGTTIFRNLTPETSYTVTVQSLTVIDGQNNPGGEPLEGTISTEDASVVEEPPNKITADALTLTNQGAGELKITWNTPEANTVTGYNVYYWTGDTPPDSRQYPAKMKETNIVFSVNPGIYRVRVDVLSSYPDQKLVTGDPAGPITIYDKPVSPTGLKVTFSDGSFRNIGDKLYATGYPLTYTGAATLEEAGGPLANLHYHYRYQVAGGDWGSYTDIAKDSVIDLLVDDLSDAAVVKAGYGKKYDVELVASNEGGFISEPASYTFTYKSFPEPFNHSKDSGYLTVTTPGERSLTVDWLAVTEVNESDVSGYIVLLKDDRYGSPVRNIDTSERRVVFENLDNKPYYITVIPNSTVTGNIFDALSMDIDAALTAGSTEERVLTAYTGTPEPHTPKIPLNAPEAVVDLKVVDGENQATVTWKKATTGSDATKYELQYLTEVTAPITHINTGGSEADSELGKLSWEAATTLEEPANESGSYSKTVTGLNVSAINVFRVRAVVEGSGESVGSAYRYYALRVEPSLPPGSVAPLIFSNHQLSGSFTVAWTKPDPGQDKGVQGVPATLVGYRVSWGTDLANLGTPDKINDPETLSYTITGLTPGTQYHVKVEARNDNQVNNYSETTGSTYTIKAPGAVVATTISYSEATNDSFKVSWDAVTDTGNGPDGPPTSVVYLIDLNQGGAWQSITRSDDTATTETITGLTPGVYRVRVAASNSYGSGAFVVGDEITLKSSESPIGKVGSLGVSDPSYDNTTTPHTGGFKVSWAVPTEGTATGYNVFYKIKGSTGDYQSASHTGTGTEYVFTGLDPGKEYEIKVSANDADGTGEEEIVSGWTPSVPGAVDPVSIEFPIISTTTVKITWTAPAEGKAGGSSDATTATTYKVEISSDNGASYTEVANNYPGTTIEASGLTKSTTYLVQITAKNKWGDATASTKNVDTLENPPTPPAVVGNLKVDSFTYNTVDLSWTAPTDKGTIDGTAAATISGYVISYKTIGEFVELATDANEGKPRLRSALDGDSTSAFIINLIPGTAYTFEVKAVNSAGLESAGTMTTPLTTPSAVATPQNLREASCIKDDSVELTWSTPDRATFYKLYRDEGHTDVTDPTVINDNISADSFTSYKDESLTVGTTYTYQVQACSPDGCSGLSSSLKVTTLDRKNWFKEVIDTGKIPTDLTGYDEMTREIFSLYSGNAVINRWYLKPNVGGTGDGTSFANASTDLQSVLNKINAGDGNIHVVLMTGGTYSAGGVAMENNVAIIGGVDECLAPSTTATVIRGSANSRVFYNDGNGLNNTALLYGVTVSGGNATGTDTDDDGKGGGMFNRGSSPSIVRVIFSGNTANTTAGGGGGMYNDRSSPDLRYVTFSGNTAYEGGGMYNSLRSGVGTLNNIFSPNLYRVTFSGNTAKDGGGMYNGRGVRPRLEEVTFSENKATLLEYGRGGGIYNVDDKGSTLIGVTFSKNTASQNGGGIYITGSEEALLVGVTFFGNKATGGGAIENSTGKIRIYNSILWGNTAPTQFNGTPSIYNSIVEGGVGDLDAARHSGIIIINPSLQAFADYGNSVSTYAIKSGSSAINRGLYIKKEGTTYYHSEGGNWYTNPDLSGEATEPPTSAEDLTATDATGFTRTGRPDIGAYEVRPE